MTKVTTACGASDWIDVWTASADELTFVYMFRSDRLLIASHNIAEQDNAGPCRRDLANQRIGRRQMAAEDHHEDEEMIKLAGSTFAFGDISLEESCDVLKDLGFDLARRGFAGSCERTEEQTGGNPNRAWV